MSEERFKMYGGPMDGRKYERPEKTLQPRSVPALAFGNSLYVFYPLNGTLGWHYAGEVTWTEEELERRRRALN